MTNKIFLPWLAFFKALLGLAIFLSSVSSFSQISKKSFGDWNLNIRSDFIEIYTSNESRSAFGMMCARSSALCHFYLRSSAECEIGVKTPVILNAEGSVYPASLECGIWMKKTGEVPVFWFSDRRPVINLLLDKRLLGIAMPLDDGTFSVSRFSLYGYMEAFIAVGDEFGMQQNLPFKDSRM